MNISRLIGAGLLFSIPSAGAVRMRTESMTAGGFLRSEKRVSSVVTVQGSNVRLDSDAGDKKVSQILLGQKKMIISLIHDEKRYVVVTEKQIKEMKKALNNPEAQKLLNGLMGKMTNDLAKVQYRKMRSGVRVGQWTCDEYASFNGSQKQTDICLVTGALASAMKTAGQGAKRAADFVVEGLGGDAGKQYMEAAEKAAMARNGVSVRFRMYDGDKVTFSSEVKEVQTSYPSSNADFSIPSGYTTKAE